MTSLVPTQVLAKIVEMYHERHQSVRIKAVVDEYSEYDEQEVLDHIKTLEGQGYIKVSKLDSSGRLVRQRVEPTPKGIVSIREYLSNGGVTILDYHEMSTRVVRWMVERHETEQEQAFSKETIAKHFGLTPDQAGRIIGILHTQGLVRGLYGDGTWQDCVLTEQGFLAASATFATSPPSISVGPGAVANIAVNSGGSVVQHLTQQTPQSDIVKLLEALLDLVETQVPEEEKEQERTTLKTARLAARKRTFESVKLILPLLGPALQATTAFMQLQRALQGS